MYTSAYLPFCDYTSMKQLFQDLSILASIAMFTVIIMTFTGMPDLAYAKEYDFVAGIHNEVTFHFRDGVETKFSCFLTTSDLVSNIGSSFEVEGVVGNDPHLHNALDKAYLHRMNTLTADGTFEYNYRYFDVDVNIVQNENILKSFTYRN